jgi:hypothetical protein
MEDFFGWVTKFDAPIVVTILVLFIIILMLLRIKGLSDIIKLLFKSEKGRKCGDCVLILFGMSEKYHSESLEIKTSILRCQMSYYEQKIQEIYLWLTQSFQEDIRILGVGKPSTVKITQFANYQEALKNSLSCVKNEVRKAFKENGFSHMSEVDFEDYVKSKVKTLISIAQMYLSTYYTQTDETIVSLKYRYDKLDVKRIYETFLDIFGRAKSIELEAAEKTKLLKSTFGTDIDNFTSSNKS